MLNLPASPAQYNKEDQTSLRRALTDADAQNVKKDEEWNARRLVLTDTVTGARYNVTVASGVLTLVAL